MDRLNSIDETPQLDRTKQTRERVKKLEQLNIFPNETVTDTEGMIINLCKEQRWVVNQNSNDIPDAFFDKDIVSTTQSLGRIDTITNILDQKLTINHNWSRLVTYIDLVKHLNEFLQVRLRYELLDSNVVVKWIVVDTSNPEESVYILIAQSEEVSNLWEQNFLRMSSTKNSVSIKVFKYFMFDGEGSMLEDYSYTELDNDRVEADLNSKKLNLKIVDNFAGVFVQDRFTLPLDGDDAMGVIRFEEVIDLIKNELKNVPDKLAVLKRFNLKNHEIRVEMESHVGIENNSPKLSQIVTNLERMVEEVKDDDVLVSK
ncbi:hypothetical protein KC675_01160 [Candidatus Dojkabacteria bacterium]|uniref:Uncharacterized protein n=1 Tax=Candidatus Dojkabacteria bacterium TaxID=2099670 RepID=A0A955I8M7_9BACT|nr:hypothetical protein [Candidatus Dojkabacteria bacterium]